MKTKEQPHVRAKTTVEVHRLFHIHSLGKVLASSNDGSLREIGCQIRSHCTRMLAPYVNAQNALRELEERVANLKGPR